jgi:hypothetical protein
MGKPAQVLTRIIRNYLALNGWLTWCNRSGCTKIGDRFIKFQEAGLPDIMAVKGGRLLCVEVKAGKDRLSPAQVSFLDLARVHGALVCVAHSLEDVQQQLLKEQPTTKEK